MIVQVTAEEIAKLIHDRFARLGLMALNDEEAAYISQVGFINGEIVGVVAINEEIPDGMFDGDDDDNLDDPSDDPDLGKSAEVSNTSGETKGKKGKRRRRTRAEIEADEAAARQAASAPAVATAAEPSVETAVEAVKEEKAVEVEEPKAEVVTSSEGSVAGSDLDLFSQPAETEVAGQAVVEDTAPFDTTDAVEVVTVAGSDPFASGSAEPASNLFGGPEEITPVTTTEGGFSKPAGETDPLDLFS